MSTTAPSATTLIAGSPARNQLSALTASRPPGAACLEPSPAVVELTISGCRDSRDDLSGSMQATVERQRVHVAIVAGLPRGDTWQVAHGLVRNYHALRVGFDATHPASKEVSEQHGVREQPEVAIVRVIVELSHPDGALRR